MRLPDPFLAGYVTVLVQAGLDVNRADPDGNTLLHTLCSRGSLDVVRALLATKLCEISATNHQGQTALWCALVHDNTPNVSISLPLVQQLIAEGAIFGSRADAKARDVFLLAKQEVYTYLQQAVGTKDEPRRNTLDRLIYGRTPPLLVENR